MGDKKGVAFFFIMFWTMIFIYKIKISFSETITVEKNDVFVVVKYHRSLLPVLLVTLDTGLSSILTDIRAVPFGTVLFKSCDEDDLKHGHETTHQQLNGRTHQ